MTNKDNISLQTSELHPQAEEIALEKPTLSLENIHAMSAEEIQQMFHELRVHQIELEMQNDELRMAQAQIEAGQARYYDLYDLAPVGYCTLSEHGLILEANLTAASLLGLPRSELVTQPLSRFILKDDQDIYYLHRKQLLKTSTLQKCDLRLVKPDGGYIWAHLKGTITQVDDGAPLCRVVLSDITERKRAEAVLRESEARLTSLLDETQVHLWVFDGTSYKFFNKQWYDFTGQNPADAKTIEAWTSAVHPDDLPKVTEIWLQHWATRTEHDNYFRLRRHDGVYRDFFCHTLPLFDEYGVFQAFQGFNLDITERRQAEEALQASENRFRNLLENIPTVAVQGYDENGITCYWNQASERLYGYRADEAIGRSLLDLIIPAEMHDGVREAMREMFETAVPIPAGELPLRRKDGSRVDVLSSHAFVHVPGRSPEMFCLDVDISERKQAEAVLRESEERFRHLVHHLNSGVVVHAADTQIILANDQAATILGISIDQMEGKTAIDHAWRFVREDESILPLEEYPVQRVFAERQPVSDLVIGIDRPITKDRVWVIVNAFPEFDAQGRLHQAVVTFIDITERKQAEAERERLHAQLSQIQKAESLGCMAGAIAHIFNNQLYVVIANLEMAIADLPRDAKPATLLNAAKQGALNAAQVSGVMLSYLGQTTGLHVPLDLSESCRQSLLSLQTETSHGPVLKVNLPSPGPTVKANANQIQQMLANLVTNAREAIGKKQGTITLTVKTVPQTDISEVHRYPVNWQAQNTSYACLEVTDTGCGIASEAIDRVFDPFFSTKFTGRGLGLPVVYGTVRSHKGVITVASNEHGSTFQVFLPLSAEEIAMPPGRTPQPFAREGSGTVLLIEDEEIVRNMAKAMIMRLGYTVLAAKDGIEAMEMFARHQDEIRCVFSDVTMPRMNGWETLAALRKLSPDIPVILCSGYDEAQVLTGDHPERPQAFLHKPYQTVELQAALAKAMAN